MNKKFIIGGMVMMLPIAVHAGERDADSSIYASQEISEVVVTGYKSNHRNLAPASVSLIGATQINNKQITHLSDLSGMLPNFFMPEYGSRQTTPIAIRGVMSKVKTTAVGFYVDGIPHFETSAFDLNMLDLKAIEVYNGPQGTLYGKNTIGGVINAYTYSPFEQQGTKVRLGYGNHNQMLAQFAHNSRLTDKLGLHVSGYYQHTDGYFKNVILDTKADKMNLAGGKIGLYWNPAERWQFRLSSSLDYTNQNGYPYAVYDAEKDEIGDISYNRPSGYQRIMSITGLNVRYQGNGFVLNSMTAYEHIHDKQRVDQDFTPKDLYSVFNGFNQNIWSEEIIIKSDNDSRFQWIAGVFGSSENSHQHQNTLYVSQFRDQHSYYRVPTQNVAIYAQASYNFWKGLSATLGARLDYEHSKLDLDRFTLSAIPNGDISLKEDKFWGSMHKTQFIPKFGLQYDFNKTNQIFAAITRGYKAGAFNQSFLTDAERSYAPEFNWNYEVGTKLSTADKKLSGQLTLFYIDWRHQQISRTVPGLGNIISNAGHSNSKGVEAQVAYMPITGLMLRANYGYTYAQLLDYKKSETVDYSGNFTPMVPRHTMALDATYSIYPKNSVDRITLNANLTGQGKLYWNEDNLQKQPFYALLGAKVAVEKGPFTVELWGKNLTDTDYMSYYFVAGPKYAQRGMPITFGGNVIIQL